MNLLEKAERENYQRQIDSLRAKLNSALDKRKATIRKNGELIQENQDLRARVAELESLLEQKERCQCSDTETCAYVRRAAELERLLRACREAMKIAQGGPTNWTSMIAALDSALNQKP